jgi:cystathionine gamma-synthase
MKPVLRLATQLAHGRPQEGSTGHAPYGEVTPPIHLSSTFERSPDGQIDRLYARDASPAYDAVEQLLASIEQGSAAKLFASGMAAASAVLATLRPGERLLAPQRMYWALRAWLITQSQQGAFQLNFYDNISLDDLRARLVQSPTRLVWVETPANPTWEITDIRAVVTLAHQNGARVIVDSTVATPVLTRPIALGADLVLHSATKYLNGHTDVVAGALITRTCDEDWSHIGNWRAHGGAILGPFEAWLLQRGLRTLHLRVSTACANALTLAQWLETQDSISQVLYPGLASHPQHSIAARQMQGGFGGMLSFRVKGGEAAALAVSRTFKLFRRATSLGGVESLAEHRASVEGKGSMCPTDLIRLSVGIEALEDLQADLLQALGARTQKASPHSSP